MFYLTVTIFELNIKLPQTIFSFRGGIFGFRYQVRAAIMLLLLIAKKLYLRKIVTSSGLW